MMRHIDSDYSLFDEDDYRSPLPSKLIKKPVKKKKQKGWRSYRNTYLKNKENYGIYVYNGQDAEGIFVLTRTY